MPKWADVFERARRRKGRLDGRARVEGERGDLYVSGRKGRERVATR